MNRKRKLLIYGGSWSSSWPWRLFFNPGFDELKQMAYRARIPLVVFLHAEKPEMQAGKYNEQGQEIIAWCQKNGVKLVKDIDCGFTLDDYRDDIHINARGQRKLASVMEKAF